MFRAPASRSLLQSLKSSTAQSRPVTAASSINLSKAQLTSRVHTWSSQRPRVLALALQQVHRQRYATRGWEHDAKHEQEFKEKKMTPHPELVSETSSVHSLFHEVGTDDKKPNDVDMTAGIKSDFKTIKETFDLSEVPRQAYVLGLAGLLPYLGTSLSTVLCAYEINRAHTHGIGFLMTEDQATYALHLLEHLQVGYGAVIISFLGAIHWGLEWAGYGGYKGYSRYAIGVIAPAIAWPTTLLPHTYALITQFLAFNWLYYTDARATRRGWTPPWYGTYRFVLTFIVGASIVVSLVGRGNIAEKQRQVPKAVERISGLHETYEEALKAEEKARTSKLVKQDKAKSVEPEVESLDELEEPEEEEEGGEEEGKKGDDKESGDDEKKGEKKDEKKEKSDDKKDSKGKEEKSDDGDDSKDDGGDDGGDDAEGDDDKKEDKEDKKEDKEDKKEDKKGKK